MSNDIDAAVVLGLAGKVSQVFAERGTYLSFGLAPMGWERSHLEALAADPQSAVGQSELAKFSLLVNEIPNGPIWDPKGDRLWDIYGDVLVEAELAEATRTPEEEADYEHAYGLLYRNQPDGAVVDTSLVVTYKQYQDAYLAAAREYNNRKGEASLSADARVKNLWTADEPILRARMAKAEQDWAIAGHRAEVDNAVRVLQDFASRSPLMAWAGYRKLYDPNMPEAYFQTSVVDGSRYLPTTYFPTDVVEAAWPTITVTRDELAALSAAAPEGLRSRLSGGSDPAAVEKVSFEYSSVTVNRPWFAPEVFGSRAWRFYDPGRILSDGGTPPSGQCTAYVSGLVLARNIRLTRPASGPQAIGLGFLPAERSARPALVVRPQPASIVIDRANARARTVAAASDRAAALRTVRTPSLDSPSMSARLPTMVPRVTATAAAGREINVAAAGSGVTARPFSIAPIPGIRQLFLHPSIRPSDPEAESPAADSNYVYVLAFICRLVPKAPNPDPQLQW